MISPGRRCGVWLVRAVGRVMSISASHCEKTWLVTKKQSSRKTTSIIGVSWKPDRLGFDLFLPEVHAAPLKIRAREVGGEFFSRFATSLAVRPRK
jgi:hypothetical protein